MNTVVSGLSILKSKGLDSINNVKNLTGLGGFKFEALEDFDNHKVILFLYNPQADLRGFIAIHRGGVEKPSFGATRLWKYAFEQDALEDALKLSRGMSYKSALAGLNYGGAKAVIIDTPKNKKQRELLLRVYAQMVNFLGGRFITGADVGVSPQDVEVMGSECKYIVGFKGDPVEFTVRGVINSIKVCMSEVFGSDSLEGKKFAIQGLGKTGMGLLEQIYPDAQKIFVAEINETIINSAKEMYPNIEVVDPKDIDKQEVDVFSPCALSGAINSKNISTFKCKVIAGSANNQLENTNLGEKLYQAGILYAPDYVVNAGGLITVADEYENEKFDKSRIIKKVDKIKDTLQAIILRSKKESKATNLVADEIAEEIFEKII